MSGVGFGNFCSLFATKILLIRWIRFKFQFQISIKDQIPKYFQAETRLVTTQCIILEAESLGAKVQGATGIVKQFLVHKCGHEKGPKSGIACIKSMVSIHTVLENWIKFVITAYSPFGRLKTIGMWLHRKIVNFRNIYAKSRANRFCICTRKRQYWNNHRSLAERPSN